MGRNRRRWRPPARLPATLLLIAVGLAIVPLGTSAIVHGNNGARWFEAPREPTGQAPDPSTTPEAVVQVYAARAWGWRGAFGVHTWFALKAANATDYTRLEVIGWGTGRGRPALRSTRGSPDNQWFGSSPRLLADYRGAEAGRMIPRILEAAEAYPFRGAYRVWPGPNSNTFTAFVARKVPELRLELSPLAVGKDYLVDGVIGPVPSGTGYQLSLFGLAGVLLAADEGLEIQLLGLTLGLDPEDLAVKLPGLGMLGPHGAGP